MAVGGSTSEEAADMYLANIPRCSGTQSGRKHNSGTGSWTGIQSNNMHPNMAFNMAGIQTMSFSTTRCARNEECDERLCGKFTQTL